MDECIYLDERRSKSNSLTNRQYFRSVIYSQNVGNLQKSLLRYKQRDPGLLIIERLLLSTCLNPRISLTIYEGHERMETKTTDFSDTLQLQQKETPHIDLFSSRVSHQLPNYISWKLDLLGKERDAFQ